MEHHLLRDIGDESFCLQRKLSYVQLFDLAVPDVC
jgi:hypothetical protein